MSRHPIQAVLSRAEEIYQALHGFHVDGGPGQPGPLVSRSFGQIIAGGIIREMSGHIADRAAAAKVKQQGRELVQMGAGNLVPGYDRAEAPWLDLPFPFPWPPKKFDSHESVFDTLPSGSLDHLLVSLAGKLSEIAAGEVERPIRVA